MTEAEWLSSSDPAAMLNWLRALREATERPAPATVNWPKHRASDRKLRLFAVACCRQVWHLLTDDAPCSRCAGGSQPGYIMPSAVWETCPSCGGSGKSGVNRSRRAVEVAERYADGTATVEELDASHSYHGALAALRPYQNPDREDELRHAAALAYRVSTPPGSETVMAQEVVSGYKSALDNHRGVQAALLRDVFGNPFCVQDASQFKRKQFFTAWRIAQRIYDERAFERMPILADSLEEAGCTDADILNHCRCRKRCPWADDNPAIDHGGKDWKEMACLCLGTGWIHDDTPHVRGCHVLDLLLGKE